MKDSNIEWTDHTFNPWEGCTKVSPGCLHCYAETRNLRWAGGANWGKGAPRRRTSVSNWKQPLKWNEEAGDKAQLFGNIEWARQAIASETRRPRVFCASLADWLDDEVDPTWLADLLHLIYRCQNLDWLLLTKRPQLWRDRMAAALKSEIFARESADFWGWVDAWLRGSAPANVWIGTTVEDQVRANERVPQLLAIPARVRFLSCEPLLESVVLPETALHRWISNGVTTAEFTGPRVHWVICGGESGPECRPMNPVWAHALQKQCAAAGVPFFFKQWGEYCSNDEMPVGMTYHEDTTFKTFGDEAVWRIGKKHAGRFLGGKIYSEFPEIV